MGKIFDHSRVGFDHVGMIEERARVEFVERRVISGSRRPELDIGDALNPSSTAGGACPFADREQVVFDSATATASAPQRFSGSVFTSVL